MKEKWEKPKLSILSLKDTQTPNQKGKTKTYEAFRVKDGVTTTSTSS